MLRPTPGDLWGVEQQHLNTGAKHHVHIFNGFKNAILDSMSVSSKRPNISNINNEIVKSYHLTCIGCQNQNVLAYGYRDIETILE